jgi:hypothetical protein
MHQTTITTRKAIFCAYWYFKTFTVYWHASEFTTGLKCVETMNPGTKKDVIAKLKAILDGMGIEGLQKAINAGIEKYGIANHF